jgi:hypothetical protein
MKEAKIADKVCVACRGLPGMVKKYGRSLFARRNWRAIYKKYFELLKKYAPELDLLKIEAEAASDELREILWADFISGRWDIFLRKHFSFNTPLDKINDVRLRNTLEVTNWRAARNQLSKEFEEGNSLLAGKALNVLELFKYNYDMYYKRNSEIEAEAENIIREERGLPLIGQGWVSETELFRLVQDVVAPSAALQHARLPWLGRQHLDIYVPYLGLAIEYMGEQHYHPIEFFGGKDALQKRKELDKRKAKLCRENGVKLVYFTAEDEVSIDTIEKLLMRTKGRAVGGGPKSA